MKNKISVSVVGVGAMGGAIASCLLDPAVIATQKANGNIVRLTVCDIDENKLLSFNGQCDVTRSAEKAVSSSEYVILAVPPTAAEVFTPLYFSGKVVISIMAGVSLDALKAITGSTKLVRAMPNINAAVGESFTAYCASGLSSEEARTVTELIGSFGAFKEIAEGEIEAVTGVTGCAPAFVFTAIKATYDAAVSQGFDSATAKQMAVQVFYGSALAAERFSGSFDELVSSVCTKGGATAKGVQVLHDGKFYETLVAAIEKSTARAKEMKK